MRAALRVSIGLFLIFPFLVWIVFVPAWSWPRMSEFGPVLLLSAGQALLSAGFALAGGFFLFQGLQAWPGRLSRGMEFALLLPNLVPPLFVALSLLAWTPLLGEFPFGLPAVVFAHVLLNAGLVAVALDRLVKARVGGLAHAAWVMGSSARTFWRKVALPLLAPDLGYLFLFVFSMCFTSFSLPLLLGGRRAVTLEVSIYNAIREEGRWDKAVVLAGFQCLFLFAAASVLPRSSARSREARWPLPYLGVSWARLWVCVPSAVLVLGWFKGFAPALILGLERALWWPATLGLVTSLALGLAVGLLHVVIFLLIAYVSPSARLERFLNGYLAPSAAITGFGMLLIPLDGGLARLILTAIALTMISLPSLYRWIVHSALSGLVQQVAVARSLGARWTLVLFEVVWPQTASRILLAAGLGALWASGDFAVSGILLGPNETLPLVMSNLLNNYRFEQAELLLLPLMAMGLLLFALISGVTRYVAR